jgi:hypothetical protein
MDPDGHGRQVLGRQLGAGQPVADEEQRPEKEGDLERRAQVRPAQKAGQAGGLRRPGRVCAFALVAQVRVHAVIIPASCQPVE